MLGSDAVWPVGFCDHMYVRLHFVGTVRYLVGTVRYRVFEISLMKYACTFAIQFDSKK